MDIQVYCAHSRMVDIEAMVENPRNPNKHSDKQISLLAKIIKSQGWRNPIVVSNRSGFIVKGHCRLAAARLLGVESVPVDYQDYETEAAEWADMIADNKIAELSNMDEQMLNGLMQELEGEIDLALTGFDDAAITAMLAQTDDIEDIPDAVQLDADNDITVTTMPFISYGAKKVYMQPDEVERFERLLKNYSGQQGNYNGLVLEMLDYGDSRYRNNEAPNNHES